jgi:hypothetical protein
MKQFIKKLFASLDNYSLGYSGRKLSSLAGVMVGVYITVHEIPKTDLITALYAWLGFALLCLGIVTVQNIIDFKNGKENNNTDSNINA